MNRKMTWLAGGKIAAVFAVGVIAGGVLVPMVQAASSDTHPAGDAPTKVLIDNDKVKVSLVTFSKGFRREGGMQRVNDQVIVFLDDGDYTIPPRPGAAPPANPPSPAQPPVRGPESSIAPDGSVVVHGLHPSGTVAWHPRDSKNMTMEINKPFRQIYIEMKK